jgi:hypothetical protein
MEEQDKQDKFSQFWSIYPRKVARKDAIKAWEKLPDSDKSLALSTIPAHVQFWSVSGTEPQFIPYPASWLNGERFHDEIEIPKPKPETGWQKTEQGILSEGARKGLNAKPGESLWDFRSRVRAA